jgi:hypothetical protein
LAAAAAAAAETVVEEVVEVVETAEGVVVVANGVTLEEEVNGAEDNPSSPTDRLPNPANPAAEANGVSPSSLSSPVVAVSGVNPSSPAVEARSSSSRPAAAMTDPMKKTSAPGPATALVRSPLILLNLTNHD